MSETPTKKEIYLDHAATTPVDPRVLEAMLPYFSTEYGNPQSKHQKGQKARIALDNARENIAQILNCKTGEIIFTSGGTESNNLAILGSALGKPKGHLITSTIEHASVLEPMSHLEKQGFQITYLETDHEGLINPEDLEKALRPDTILVSIMYANNEIGTIQPIQKLAEICHKHSVPFHTDACQAANSENLDTQALNINLLTLNASKIYGPKGVGALYIGASTKIEPLFFGGGQEKNLRSGTANIPSIVGFAKALELTQQEKAAENKRQIKLRDHFIETILKNLTGVKLNGPKTQSSDPAKRWRLPNNINLAIEGIHDQELLLQLDEAGIYASSGSACSAKSTEPSHVLQAIKLPKNLLQNSIRLTLGKTTTDEDLDYAAQTLIKLVNKLRSRW